MSADFQSRLLVQFCDPTDAYRPDCSEKISNACLHFLRTALGGNCPPSRAQLILKTDSVALQAFALLLACTLWLPLTILGVVLCLNSQTHAQTYATATKAAEHNPVPTTSSPPQQTPAPNATDLFKERLSTTLPSSDLKEVANLSKEELTKRLTEVTQAPSSKTKEYKMNLVLTAAKQFPMRLQVRHMKPDMLNLLDALEGLLCALPPEELAEIFPHIPPFHQKQREVWLSSDRALAMARILLTQCKPKADAALWNTWKQLWDEFGDRWSDCADKANDTQEKMKSDALQIIGNDSAMLATYVDTISYSARYEKRYISAKTIDGMNVDQLQALIKGYKDASGSKLLQLVNAITCHSHQSKLSFEEICNRAALVSLALGCDPLEWVAAFTDLDDARNAFEPLTYLVVSAVNQAFNNPESAREESVKLLARALDVYINAREAPIQGITAQADVFKELAQRASIDPQYRFSLLVDGFNKAFESAILRRSSSTPGPIPECFQKAALSIMQEFLSKEHTQEDYYHVFTAIFSLKIFENTQECLQFFQKLLPNLKFSPAFTPLLDVCLTMATKGQEDNNTPLDLLKSAYETTSFPGAFDQLVNDRRQHLETLVTTALTKNGSALLPPIIQLVLDYYISLPPTTARIGK